MLQVSVFEVGARFFDRACVGFLQSGEWEARSRWRMQWGLKRKCLAEKEESCGMRRWETEMADNGTARRGTAPEQDSSEHRGRCADPQVAECLSVRRDGECYRGVHAALPPE